MQKLRQTPAAAEDAERAQSAEEVRVVATAIKFFSPLGSPESFRPSTSQCVPK
jgi:hypothetical protein